MPATARGSRPSRGRGRWERKLHQDALRYLSEHDALTGLLNRRGLDHHLAQAMAHARRHDVPTALLLMDLDGFKLVNDQLGHLEGDRLLCSVVHSLRERLRAGDAVARLGGDEFAVVLPYAAMPAAEMIAQDLLAVVRDTATAVTAGAVGMTASIGVVSLGRPQQDPVGAIAAADAAMYAGWGRGARGARGRARRGSRVAGWRSAANYGSGCGTTPSARARRGRRLGSCSPKRLRHSYDVGVPT